MQPAKRRLSLIPRQKNSQNFQEEQYFADPIEKGKQVVRILRKSQLQRSEYETQILKNSLRDIAFFREHFNPHYEDMLEDVCENARLKVAYKSEIVIQQVILGSVRVIKKVVTFLGYIEKDNKQVPHQIEEIKNITKLSIGDYFGELALIENQPRGATCYCETDCYFLTLDKNSFQRIVGTKAKRQFIHLVDELRQNYIMRELSTQTVKALFLTMERLVLNYGNYLYRQNEPSEAIYFILQGEFKMLVERNESKTNKSQEVCVIGKNECVGLIEFMVEGNRNSSVICTSQEGILFKLGSVDFRRLEFRYPDVCQLIKTVAAEKKTFFEDRIKDLRNDKSSEVKESEDINYLNQKFEEKQQETQIFARNQISNKENNEIMMKFSKFFSIEEQFQPFQINSVQQIEKYRVKSAGYRVSQIITEESHLKENNLFLRKKHKHLCTSVPLISHESQKTLSPPSEKDKSQQNTKNSFNKKRFSQDSKKNNRSNKVTLKKETSQNQILQYLKLNKQQIQKIAQKIHLRNQDQMNIRKFQKTAYKDKSIPELINRIKSAKKKRSLKTEISISKMDVCNDNLALQNQNKSYFQRIRQRRPNTSALLPQEPFSQQKLQPQMGQRIHQSSSELKPVSCLEEQIKQCQMPLKYFINFLHRKQPSRSKIITPVTQSLKYSNSSISFQLNQK